MEPGGPGPNSLDAQLGSFQKLVADLFYELSAASPDDFLSVPWIMRLEDAFISCQEEFSVIMSYHRAYVSKPPANELLSEFLDSSLTALDICNAIKQGIYKIGEWQNYLELIVTALEWRQRIMGETQFRRARIALNKLSPLMLQENKTGKIFSLRNWRPFSRRKDSHKPAPSTQTQNPGPSSQPGSSSQPGPSSQTDKPGSSSQAEKPGSSRQAEKPGPLRQAEKPSSSSQSEKPGSSSQSKKPGPSRQAEKPSPSRQAEKPSPLRQSEKPGPSRQDEKRKSEKPGPSSQSEKLGSSAAKKLKWMAKKLVAPRGSSEMDDGPAVAIFTMGFVRMFVLWVLVAAILPRKGGRSSIKSSGFSIPTEFKWGASLYIIHKRIKKASKKKKRKYRLGLMKEIHEIEKSVRKINKLVDSANKFPLDVQQKREACNRANELYRVYQDCRNWWCPLEQRSKQVYQQIAGWLFQGYNLLRYSSN